MASISVTQSSLTVYWSSFGVTGNSALNYNVELYRGGSTLVNYDYGLSSTARSYTFYNLPSGTYYAVKVYAQMQTGSNKVEWAYGTTDSPTIYPPSTPSGLYASAGNGYIYISWSSVYNADYYCVEVSDNYGIDRWTNYNITGTSVYAYVPNGVTYTVKLYAKNSGGNSYPTYYYNLTPMGNPPATPTGFYLTGKGDGYLSFAWNYVSNVVAYCVEIIHAASGEEVRTNYNITNTYVTMSPLNNNVNYTAKLYARNNDGNSNPTYLYNLTAGIAIPPMPTGLSVSYSSSIAGRLTFSWSPSSNATSYYVTARLGSASGTIAYQNTVYSTSAEMSLVEYKTYYLTVSASNNGGTSNYNTFIANTPDLTPPNIATLNGDGNGRMYISFSATDAGSGMRPTSTYYTEIGTMNGNGDASAYAQGSYSTNTYRTFVADANGKEFVHNAYYYMRVIAFDAAANSSNKTVRVQYKVARPVNWSWINSSFVKDQPITIIASEWNSFCLRINQFRQYKGLDNYSFTSAVSGQPIAASIVNQARSAISSMTTVPSAVSTGDVITASFFNTLTINLNNIT